MFKVEYDYLDERGDRQMGSIGNADTFHPRFYMWEGKFFVSYNGTDILITRNEKLAERVVDVIKKRFKSYEHYHLEEDTLYVPKIVESFSEEIETVAEYDEIIGGTLEHMSEVDR